MNMIMMEDGMCISCAKEKITKHGFFCDACAKPYADIKGDNEQQNPVQFYNRGEVIEWVKETWTKMMR